jgi:ABC-type multidrug transport system ATPase subunit
MTASPKNQLLTLDLSGIPDGDALVIGRDKNCDLIIDSPEISGRHLQISLKTEGAFIRDLQSRKGTLINGRKLKGIIRLNNADKIELADHAFVIKLPERLCMTGCGISLRNIHARVGDKTILENISLNVRPGEFVGVVGPSGCGKSTLINIISGSRNADDGEIFINGYETTGATLREKVGYLPQAVVIHERLKCHEVMRYASELYHGAHSPLDALSMTGLDVCKDQLVKTLSGGQQKRAGLAQELLFSPELLCLDEVTSGLDPLSEQEMMLLFKQLSGKGKTILCITHYPERLLLCDKLVVLLAGKLIFYGTPLEAMRHFNIDSLEQLYGVLQCHTPEHWRNFMPRQESAAPPAPTQKAPPPTGATNILEQLFPLLSRNIKLWLRSPGELIFLLLQGIVIGMLIGLCFGGKPDGISIAETCSRNNQLVFSLVLSAIWIGATSAVREIVKERRILVHEGRKRLSATSYVLSKLIILSIISSVNTLIVSVLVIEWTGLDLDVSSLLTSLLLTATVSTALGLMVSGLSSSQEKALTILPVMIIGLVMFSGGIYELKGASLKLARYASYSYWALNSARHSLPQKIINARAPIVEAQDSAPPRIRMRQLMRKPQNRSKSLLIAALSGIAFICAAATGVKHTIRRSS